MRTIKTAIAVLACILLFHLLQYSSQFIHPMDSLFLSIVKFLLYRENPIFACVAAVIVMQATVESSLQLGMSRIWGTAIGGSFGLAMLWLDKAILNRSLNMVLITLGVVAVIYFCNLIHNKPAVSIAVITFLVIMISLDQPEPYLYAVNRIIDTAIGIVISVLINWSVRIPKIKKIKT